MQPIMLTIFMSIMSIASWSLFQQMNMRQQSQDVEAVVHTVRELAKTQRVWHTQHGEGVPWQDRYLTHVPDNCPPPPAACDPDRWLRLSAPLWYCQIFTPANQGDRLPVFGSSPACPPSINGKAIVGEITDRDGNPKGTSATVAEASIQGQAVPWWNEGHPDADDYATWATRDGPTALAGDHSFQVIYRAGPVAAGAPAEIWQEARARAHRVANALGAPACIGRREGSTVNNTWYDCDAGAEIGRQRGPGGTGDNAPYYVIARYERPLARTMVESMMSRSGKQYLYGDFELKLDAGVGTTQLSKLKLTHRRGRLLTDNLDQVVVGCGSLDNLGDTCTGDRIPSIVLRPHAHLDARAFPSHIRGDPEFPGLYMRTVRYGVHGNEVPIKLAGSQNGPRVTFGRIQMRVDNRPDPSAEYPIGVVEGIWNLQGPGGTGVKLKPDSGKKKHVVVCSDQYVDKCTDYHP